MKTQVANYETRVLCLRIVPVIGAKVQITHYPRDLIMSNGEVYKTGSGYDFTGYTAGSGMSAAMVELGGIAGFAGIDKDTLSSGVFDNARCYLFATNWNNPVEDYEPIVSSLLGKTTLADDKYQIEEMALIDTLNQSVGDTYTATCPKKFGGQEYAGCKFNIATATATGALTSVVNAGSFGDTSLTQVADYFAMGTIQFTSGANAGLKPQEVKSFTLGGGIVTFEPFYYAPQVGDAFTIIAGCRKRLVDCRDKWSNVINFGGFSFIPTSSSYGKYGNK